MSNRKKVAEIHHETEKVLSNFRTMLPEDSVEAIKHYLEHGEVEIALEGLCIDLISEGLMSLSDLYQLKSMAREVGLDRESVLRADFWSLLEAEEDNLKKAKK